MLKSSKNPENGKVHGKRNSAKASIAKPLGKPPHGDKTLGVDKDTCFYEIDDVDNIEEG